MLDSLITNIRVRRNLMTEFILQFGISEELKGPLIIKNKRPLRWIQFDCECSYIHIKARIQRRGIKKVE